MIYTFKYLERIYILLTYLMKLYIIFTFYFSAHFIMFYEKVYYPEYTI